MYRGCRAGLANRLEPAILAAARILRLRGELEEAGGRAVGGAARRPGEAEGVPARGPALDLDGSPFLVLGLERVERGLQRAVVGLQGGHRRRQLVEGGLGVDRRQAGGRVVVGDVDRVLGHDDAGAVGGHRLEHQAGPADKREEPAKVEKVALAKG